MRLDADLVINYIKGNQDILFHFRKKKKKKDKETSLLFLILFTHPLMFLFQVGWSLGAEKVFQEEMKQV